MIQRKHDSKQLDYEFCEVKIVKYFAMKPHVSTHKLKKHKENKFLTCRIYDHRIFQQQQFPH